MEIGNFKYLYSKQKDFQQEVEGEYPFDDPLRFQYHMNAMQEELGEVLKSDKRWKTHRNETFNKDEKIDELADCFITLMNISLWSGFDEEQIIEGVARKIKRNYDRIEGKS